jgi:hypothetical protein
MAEKKAFVQHENLLLTTIKRQAGTLKQAVEEAIQNSAAAPATVAASTRIADFIIGSSET